jgi:hypothetical protein
MNQQQQFDREINVLFLETPSATFHFLSGTHDEKQLRVINEKLSNIVLRIDSCEGMIDRKSRIERIQHIQNVIDKVIEYDTKLVSSNDIKSNLKIQSDFEIQNNNIKAIYEVQLTNSKIESDKKVSEIVSDLEKTKFALDQMTLQYNVVEQMFKNTQNLLQQKTIDYELLVQSHLPSQSVPNKQTKIETEQNLYTNAKFESLVCENEELKNNNRDMSGNIRRLQTNVNAKNREIETLSFAFRTEHAKNIKLNEALKNKNDKIAEYAKDPYTNLMGNIFNPPSFNSVKK